MKLKSHFIAALIIVLMIPVLGQANSKLLIDHLNSSQQQVRIPITEVLKVASKLRVEFHNEADLSDPVFIKGKGLQKSKLFLYSTVYNKGARIPAINELSVSATDRLYFSLYEAYFELRLKKSKPAYYKWVIQRANTLFLDVPAQFRLKAYFTAMASFAGALHAVVNDIQKSATKHGSRICEIIKRPALLFVLWDNYFLEGPSFPGEYFDGKDWGNSDYYLSVDDKKRFIRVVLEGYWEGEKYKDFGGIYGCSP